MIKYQLVIVFCTWFLKKPVSDTWYNTTHDEIPVSYNGHDGITQENSIVTDVCKWRDMHSDSYIPSSRLTKSSYCLPVKIFISKSVFSWLVNCNTAAYEEWRILCYHISFFCMKVYVPRLWYRLFEKYADNLWTYCFLNDLWIYCPFFFFWWVTSMVECM